MDYAKKVMQELDNNDIRVTLDETDEKFGYKMRQSVISKVPYTLILGDNEAKEGIISYRHRGSTETKSISLDEFIKMIKEEIMTKKND